MTRLRSVPPGRSGRLWLQHRLAVAERGVELLDQKLRILHGEATRLSLLTARTERAWLAALEEADAWLVRAGAMAGERGLRLAGVEAGAQVELVWRHTMGVRYPVDAEVTLPGRPPGAPPDASAAITAAREACRRATDAGVRHAVALAAARRVSEEERATRHRLRALSTHWVPRLSEQLARTSLGLEEQEHEDAVRLRWAHEGQGVGR